MSKGIELAEEKLQIQSVKHEQKMLGCSLDEVSLRKVLQTCGIEQANIVVWQVNKIRWGKWKQGKAVFADDESADIQLWLEVRIFNEQSELHLVREGGRLQGRFCQDGQGEAIEYVDAISRFWGEHKSGGNDWLVLEDADRKLKQVLPEATTDARFYGLITRNYIGINEKTAQAGYVDYRYVAIAPADVKE